MAGGEKLAEFLVSLGFSVQGVEKLEKAVHALENTKELFESIRAPFQAFNEATEALSRIGEMLISPFEALYELSAGASEAADELDDMSKQLGISTEDLESWGYVAELAGSSSGEMTQALRLFNREIANAANGNKESAASFHKLGVEIKDAATGKLKPAGEVFEEVLSKLSEIPDEAERAAKGMDVFGKAGVNIRAMFGLTIEQVMEMRQEFEQLGGRTPEKLKALGEEQKHLSENMATFGKGLRNWYAMGFQPVINGVIAWFEDWAKKYGPSLRLVLFNIGDGLASVAKVIGGAMDTFAQAIGFLLKNLDVILPVVAIFEYQMVAAALATIAAWVMAAAPFIAIFLLVEDFLGFLEGKDSVIGDLVESWGDWVHELEETNPVIATIMTMIGALGMSIKQAAEYVGWLIDAFQTGGLQGLVNELKESVGTALDYYKSMFMDFVTFLGSLIGTLGGKVYDSIVGPIKAALGAIGIGGGGPTIGPSVGNTGSVTNNSNSASMSASASVNVNAAPGMNERELASHVATQTREALASELRAAYPAAAPSG